MPRVRASCYEVLHTPEASEYHFTRMEAPIEGAAIGLAKVAKDAAE